MATGRMLCYSSGFSGYALTQSFKTAVPDNTYIRRAQVQVMRQGISRRVIIEGQKQHGAFTLR
jgi:hypothetical protein